MQTRRIFVMGAGLAALAACSPPSEAPEATSEATSAAPDPAAVVRPLYDRYITAPPEGTWPALEDEAPWSDDLKAQLLAMMARSQERNEPILDFAPIIGAQDGLITNVRVSTDAMAENSHAVVRAVFDNTGSEQTILYDLIWQHDQWRVDNIRGADWDLRQVIAG